MNIELQGFPDEATKQKVPAVEDNVMGPAPNTIFPNGCNSLSGDEFHSLITKRRITARQKKTVAY